MKDHLRPEGKPAPPRPRSPEAFMSVMICTGGGLGVGFGLAGIALTRMSCSGGGAELQPHSQPTLTLNLAPSLASLVRNLARSSPPTACPRPHHRARLCRHRPPRSRPSALATAPPGAACCPRRHPGMARAMQALMRRLPAPDREARSPWSCTYAGEVRGPRDTRGTRAGGSGWRVGLGGV